MAQRLKKWRTSRWRELKKVARAQHCSLASLNSGTGTVLYGRGQLGSIWGRVGYLSFPILLYYLSMVQSNGLRDAPAPSSKIFYISPPIQLVILGWTPHLFSSFSGPFWWSPWVTKRFLQLSVCQKKDLLNGPNRLQLCSSSCKYLFIGLILAPFLYASTSWCHQSNLVCQYIERKSKCIRTRTKTGCRKHKKLNLGLL